MRNQENKTEIEMNERGRSEGQKKNPSQLKYRK